MTQATLTYIMLAIGLPANAVFTWFAYWPKQFKRAMRAIARYFSKPTPETVAQDRAMDDVLPWNN